MQDIDELRKISDDRLWEKRCEEHRCEECGGNLGEDILVCLANWEGVYPDDCLSCEADACLGRGEGFKCDCCGHVTREE